VAISGDTVVVGAIADTIGAHASQGSAYVFVKPVAGWATMSETAKLTASDGAASDLFGFAVAISGDTVVVGAVVDDIGANSNQGSAYVFVKPVAGWATMTETAASPPPTVPRGLFAPRWQSAATRWWSARTPTTSARTVTRAPRVVRSRGLHRPVDRQAHRSTVPSDLFGYAVAISGDTVVVGAAATTRREQ
jgi:hypothetical protein